MRLIQVAIENVEGRVDVISGPAVMTGTVASTRIL